MSFKNKLKNEIESHMFECFNISISKYIKDILYRTLILIAVTRFILVALIPMLCVYLAVHINFLLIINIVLAISYIILKLIMNYYIKIFSDYLLSHSITRDEMYKVSKELKKGK